MEVDTSLLREKFIIKEQYIDIADKQMLIRCLSTRMPITLKAEGLPEETYIVRANNMHNCVRFASKIIQNYEKHGPITTRIKQIDWDELWDSSLNSFERRYNPNIWVSLYKEGKSIYSNGEYNQFFDVIERFDIVNKGEYHKSVKMAEKAFFTAGKDVKITYESHVAMVSILNKNGGRYSLALRGADKTSTFNYSIKPMQAEAEVNLLQGLSSAADFLDGVQLSFLIGLNNEKLSHNMISKSSDEYKKLQDAKKYLSKLNVQINSMENRYRVRYRPERPDFDLLILQTEEFSRENIMYDEDMYIN